MTPLLLVGLLTATLAGRGTVLAETTEGPVLGENPGVYAKTTEESMPTHLPTGGDDDDTETDDFTNNEPLGSEEGSGVTVQRELNDVQMSADRKTVPIYKIIIPIVLLALFLVAAVTLVIFLRRRKKKKTIPSDMKEEDALAACDAEMAPTPMFDDDIPSVQELEMEDLQNWAVKTDSAGETSSASEKES
ncbi:hypothetical protein SKAU_G00034680 [Synaphobranchus kaupii]|uniref:Transmembrane protein 154 n=1 Tax=Synaphobranchus kaupii TaxID=118154 RepID=A0A9Q1GFT8_SYNKA|nr:hypothetical protein SKAU_G00034680 [Synaphobranchus kaupii]